MRKLRMAASSRRKKCARSTLRFFCALARNVMQCVTVRLLLLPMLLIACEGPAGPSGPPGPGGSDGSNGMPGSNGQPGTTEPGSWIVDGGVDVSITSLTFDATGAHVAFTLADASGEPLDRTGHLTEGAVDVSFVLAQLAMNPDGSPAQYTAYTTRTQTSPTTMVTATQAGDRVDRHVRDRRRHPGQLSLHVRRPADRARRDQDADGRRGRGAHVRQRGVDRSRHVLRGAGGRPAARAPGGHRRDLRQLPPHARRARRSLHVSRPSACCVTSRRRPIPTPATRVDFKVMVHKIHRGKNLPSVLAGTPYQIVGFNPAGEDFSTVGFPQNIARCETCHAGAQGDRWKTQPSLAACGSCHDGRRSRRRSHQAWSRMAAVPRATRRCARSATRRPSGSRRSSASTTPACSIRRRRPSTCELLSITNTAPGAVPTLTFKVLFDGSPRDILAAPLTAITATVAGPHGRDRDRVAGQDPGHAAPSARSSRSTPRTASSPTRSPRPSRVRAR